MNETKGVYCIRINGRILTIRTSDDLERDKEVFYNGTLLTGRVDMLVKRARKSSFEILKVTDTPEKDIWFYVLPEISRVEYKSDLIEALSAGKIRRKHVERAVNWFCDIFSHDYSAEFDYTLDDYIIVKVIHNGKITEIYGFKGKRQPEYRIDYEEE